MSAVEQIDSDGKVEFRVRQGYQRPAPKAETPAPEPAKPADPKPEPYPEQPEPIIQAEQEPQQEHEFVPAKKGPQWVPKDQWSGDPDEWIPKKEFDKRQQLYDTISTTNRSLREQQDAMSELREQNRKMAEALRKSSLGGRLKERDEAIAQGDRERVYAIERDMQEINSAIPQIQAEQRQAQPQVDPSVQEWAKKNTWFNPNTEPELFYAAVGIHQNQINGRDLRPLDEQLEEVSRIVRERFPERFGQQRRQNNEQPQRRASVESPGISRGGKKSYRFSDLNETQQAVCKKFVRRGVMSEKEYIDQLVSLGELG